MSDEPIKVKKVEIEGKKYLLDKRTNIVYDRETQEPIGVLKDGKVELYNDDEEEEEEEVEITTLRIDGKKTEFYKPDDEVIDDLPNDHLISVKTFEYATGNPIKLVVQKNKDGKYEPAGIVAEENGDFDEAEDMYFISMDEPISRFFQEVGREGYTKLAKIGFAYELEEDEPVKEKVEEKVEEKEDEKTTIQKSIDRLEAEINAETNPVKKKLLIKTLGGLLKAKMKMGTGIDNPELYEKAKQIADEKYKKSSAYKSGFIIKKYKELGGTYSGEKPNKTGIARWFKEEWKDVGNKEYPVYRPTKRITKETPLTPDEIKPSNLKKQIALKQEIKGDANLPPFEEKTGGKVVALGVQAEKIPKGDDVWKWSNPVKVAEMAKKYLGDMAVVFRSTKPKKKYMIFDPDNNKWVFFGEMGYEDFTKHQDPKRRENYLTRTASMKGNWKNNRYSANNLSRNILW